MKSLYEQMGGTYRQEGDYRYLTYNFKTAPMLDQTKDNWVHSLLPENVPASCKAPSTGDV